MIIYIFWILFCFFCKLKTHLRPFQDSTRISELILTGGIFGISLCSAEQDQTLRWCQWPIWRPKSCLFALLLVYKHPLSSALGLRTFVHSFVCTWCNTHTFFCWWKETTFSQDSGCKDFFCLFGSFFFAISSLSEICPLVLLVFEQQWNSVPPDVDCVTYVLPAAVWKDSKHVSSAAVVILAVLLATPFSANSTQSYLPYVFF